MFKIHLIVFIIMNTIILTAMFVTKLGPYEHFLEWGTFTASVTWCVGLVIHAFSVYGTRILFKKSWEDRKIQEFMQEEEQIWE